MEWTNRKPSKKSYCSHCGKEIKWVRGKGAPKAVPVEPRVIYFLPDPAGRSFISSDGSIRTGHESSDGLLGYHKHDCPMKPDRRPLTEKELQARQWA